MGRRFTVIDGGLSSKEGTETDPKRSFTKYRKYSAKVAKELFYDKEVVRGIEVAKTPQEVQMWLATGRTRC